MKYFRDSPAALYYLLGVLILTLPVIYQVITKGK